jgi:hypothetical protein
MYFNWSFFLLDWLSDALCRPTRLCQCQRNTSMLNNQRCFWAVSQLLFSCPTKRYYSHCSNQYFWSSHLSTATHIRRDKQQLSLSPSFSFTVSSDKTDDKHDFISNCCCITVSNSVYHRISLFMCYRRHS